MEQQWDKALDEALAAQAPAQRERLNGLLATMRELAADPDPVRSINAYSRAMRGFYGDQGFVSVSRRGLRRGRYRIMRLMHQDGLADDGLENTPFAGPKAPAHEGGLIGAILERGEPVVLRGFDASADPVLGRQLAPYRTLLGVPVYGGEEALNWVFYLHTATDAFRPETVEGRLLQANLMGHTTNAKQAAVEQAKAMAEARHAAREQEKALTALRQVVEELQRAKAWIEREVDEIAGIQRALLPDRLPEIPGFALAASYETFDRAGGDWYDVFPMAPAENGAQRYGLLIADVAGHGPSAAVVAAMISALLHACPQELSTPGALLTWLNRQLARRAFRHALVTAFAMVIEVGVREVAYAGAGHPPPFQRDSEGRVTTVPRTPDVPLGVFDNTEYADYTLTLGPCEPLVLYTDGVLEATSPDGAHFGSEGIQRVLREAPGDVDGVVQALRETLAAHEAGARAQDDQTLVVVQLC